jgi:hypothetical protein
MYESALRDGLTKAFNKKYFLDGSRASSASRAPPRAAVGDPASTSTTSRRSTTRRPPGRRPGARSARAQGRRDHPQAEDVFARYGGEEFAVICRAIEMHGAGAFGERLRAAVEKTEFPFGGKIIPCTMSRSRGAAAGALRRVCGLSSRGADDALYQAKARRAQNRDRRPPRGAHRRPAREAGNLFLRGHGGMPVPSALSCPILGALVLATAPRHRTGRG